MTPKSLYKTLGLSEDASLVEIRNAYKKLAAKYHPDKCVDVDNVESFKKINNAYQILSDASKRAQYDTEGDDALEFLEDGDLGCFNATSAEDFFLSGAFNFFRSAFKDSLRNEGFAWESNEADEEEDEEEEDDSHYAENRRERMRDLLKELRSDDLATKQEALRHVFSHINEDNATITCECIVEFGGIPDLIKSLDSDDSEVRASCIELLTLLSPGYSQALIQCNVMPSLIEKVQAWVTEPALLNCVLLCLFHVTRNSVGAKLYVEADAVAMLHKILYIDSPESVLCASKVLTNLATADEHAQDLIQAEAPKIIARLCSLQGLASVKSKDKAKKQQKALTVQAQKTLARVVLYVISMEDSVVADFGAAVANDLFALISLKVSDLPGLAAQIFDVLSRRGLNIKAQLGDKWPQLVSVMTALVQASDHHPGLGAVAALASWITMGTTQVSVAITKAFAAALRSKDVRTVEYAIEAFTCISEEAKASEMHRKCLMQFLDAVVKQMLQFVRFERAPAFASVAPSAMACLHAMAGIDAFQAMLVKAGVFEAATSFFQAGKSTKGAESALGTLDWLSECKLVVDQNLYRDSLRTIKPQLSSPNPTLQLAALRTCIHIIQHGGSLLGIQPKLLQHLKVCRINIAEARKLYSLCDVGPEDSERSCNDVQSDSTSSGGELYCDAQSHNVFDSLTGHKKKKPKNSAAPPPSADTTKKKDDSIATGTAEEPRPKRNKKAKGYSAHSGVEDLEERFELDMELAMQWSLEGASAVSSTETVVSRRRKKERPSPPEPLPIPSRPPEPRRVPPPPRPPRGAFPKPPPATSIISRAVPQPGAAPNRPPPPEAPPSRPRASASPLSKPDRSGPPSPVPLEAEEPQQVKATAGGNSDLGKDQWPPPSKARGQAWRKDKANAAGPPERQPHRDHGGKGSYAEPPPTPPSASTGRLKGGATEGAKVTEYMPIREGAAKQESASAAPPSFLEAVVRNLTPLEPVAPVLATSPRACMQEEAAEQQQQEEEVVVATAAPQEAHMAPKPKDSPVAMGTQGNAHNLPDGAAVLMEEDLLRQLAVEVPPRADERGQPSTTPTPAAPLFPATPPRAMGVAAVTSPSSPESMEPLQTLLEQLYMKDSDPVEAAPALASQHHPQSTHEAVPQSRFGSAPHPHPPSFQQHSPAQPYAQRGYEPGIQMGQYVSQEQFVQQQQLMHQQQQQQAMLAQQQAMQYEIPYIYVQQQHQPSHQHTDYSSWGHTMPPTQLGKSGAPLPEYGNSGQHAPTTLVGVPLQPPVYPPPVRPEPQYARVPRQLPQGFGGSHPTAPYDTTNVGWQSWNESTANVPSNTAARPYGFGDAPVGTAPVYGPQTGYAPNMTQAHYQYELLPAAPPYQPYAHHYAPPHEAGYAPPGGLLYPELQPPTGVGGFLEEPKLMPNLQWDAATQRYLPPPNLAQQVTLEQKMGWSYR